MQLVYQSDRSEGRTSVLNGASLALSSPKLSVPLHDGSRTQSRPSCMLGTHKRGARSVAGDDGPFLRTVILRPTTQLS